MEAGALEINPELTYHFCNETLRDVFYSGQWAYSRCRKHRIFASSCSYPVKGFHILLEALALVRREYPDAEVCVTGRSFFAGNFQSRLRQNGYEAYLSQLVRQNRLEGAVVFLGHLSAEEMKQAYLDANVFVLASTMENSPNVLGEAMLLGLPCVAANVGGVSSLMRHGGEGRIYQSTAPYMLAYHIKELFAMGEGAVSLGQAARAHALGTHDPEKNLETLLEIYRELA